MSHDDEHEHSRIDQLAKPNIGVIKSMADAADRRLRVGQPVRFMVRGVEVRGIVCEPDDPDRSGTFTSEQYGAIPVKIDRRNHKQRRVDAARKGR